METFEVNFKSLIKLSRMNSKSKNLFFTTSNFKDPPSDMKQFLAHKPLLKMIIIVILLFIQKEVLQSHM